MGGTEELLNMNSLRRMRFYPYSNAPRYISRVLFTKAATELPGVQRNGALSRGGGVFIVAILIHTDENSQFRCEIDPSMPLRLAPDMI